MRRSIPIMKGKVGQGWVHFFLWLLSFLRFWSFLWILRFPLKLGLHDYTKTRHLEFDMPCISSKPNSLIVLLVDALAVEQEGTVSLLLAATAASFWTEPPSAQLIPVPECGTTVQVEEVAAEPPFAGASIVQFHVARLGARPEKIWIANAPTAAATALDIIIWLSQGSAKSHGQMSGNLSQSNGAETQSCVLAVLHPEKDPKSTSKKKQQVLNSGFVGNQFKQSAFRIGIQASAFDNSCEINPLWLFAEDLPKEAAQLTKIRFSILLADQVLLRDAWCRCKGMLRILLLWTSLIWRCNLKNLHLTTVFHGSPVQSRQTPPQEYTTTPKQKHHHKNTTTPPQKQHHKNNTTKTPPHHHTTRKNTTTPPQKHHHTTTKTPPQEHHHKNTNHKNTTTTPPQEHHHKNTTTKTPPQHHHKNTITKTPPHHHKNTTTRTPPQTPPPHPFYRSVRSKTSILPQFSTVVRSSPVKNVHFTSHHQKNTTTKTPPHHHKNTTTQNTATPPQKHHHKNTTTRTPPQKHHHKNTTTRTPPQKHHQQKHHRNTTTATPPQKHHHKNTNHKNTTTKTPPQEHHHKNTTTRTPPQTHHHKNTTTPRQKHHHKNTTTPPQKHHHKNTTTKTPPQEHHHKNTTKKHHRTTTRTPPHHHKNTTTPHSSTTPVLHHTTTKTPPHHKNTTAKTPPTKNHPF